MWSRRENKMSKPKKVATIITAGIAAAASMAAPALADETAVTPDEQARQAVDEAQQAVAQTGVEQARQAVTDAQAGLDWQRCVGQVLRGRVPVR
ncbi:hypothetical protein PL381_05030 [Bifidobacterium adolescentis]|nr:hypothetical protein [Bifidobacterium adolescentis]MDB0591663.1 hypothetical protein [Bifidobacterium adolescentis]MDB0595537.1 hypothetical protein [Bifidobacterium adolescentis]MDB0604441.1 hypothetical protein [Bifidobacterium adolescentis]MDB0619153.1 hypothetical protein [Bifidobacterium adolescentis]